MKLVQINTIVNSGSTGRIAEDIGKAAIANGDTSFIAAGYTNRPSQSQVIAIGSQFDRQLHGVKTLLLDRHGFGSGAATSALIRRLDDIRPDLIHLHNIHGYYLHIGKLFQYLKRVQLPVVWTFHDCWPFTGHCSFFDRVNCSKWQTECNHCPNQKGYPSSYGLDQSRRNFHEKQELFTGLPQLRVVTPSHWLANHVKHSFLSQYPVQVIHNGVDTALFSPSAANESIRTKYHLDDALPIVLGVASTWDRRKGLADFIELDHLIKGTAQIVLVGLNDEQIASLPATIRGIRRTESSTDLAAIYASASVFVNPTYVDNFPTTNLEALACGIPVITYDTGGSAEAVDAQTGFITRKGNINEIANLVRRVTDAPLHHFRELCRQRALLYFNSHDRYADYINLYHELLNIRSITSAS